MGREVRRIPYNWKHPKDENGCYIPLDGDSFSKDLEKYNMGKELWERGFCEDWSDDPRDWKPKESSQNYTYEEWAGDPPKEDEYMPYWPDEERTCSEGTPISPVMKDPEELAKWLADNGASSFGNMTATYEEWLAMIKGPGWSFSAACVPGKGIVSGISVCGDN